MAEGDYISKWALNVANTSPSGLTTDGTNIWVIDNGVGEIYKYDLNGNYVSKWALDVANTSPSGITTDGNYIWVVDAIDDEIYKYDMGGNYVSKWALNVANTSPLGIVTDGIYFWVADAIDDEIYKYDLNGNYVSKWALDVANTSPSGITTDGNYIWVVDAIDDEIYKYDMGGNYVSKWALNVANNPPRGLTTDGIYFWVVDSYNDEIYKYQGPEEAPPTEGSLDITGITTPTEAREGDEINFIVHTENTGIADNFKVELTGDITDSSEFSLGEGLTKDVPFLFTMPNQNVSITTNTHHWEVEEVPIIDALEGYGTFNTMTEFDGWTATITATDGSFSHDANGFIEGALKASTTVGRRNQFTGYMSRTTIPLTTDTTTILDFKWKWDYSVLHTDSNILKIELVKPDMSVVTLWSSSYMDPYGVWITESVDITNNITQDGNYEIRLYCMLNNGSDKNAQTFCWFDEVFLNNTVGLPSYINVTSVPEGATVLLDTVDIGLTPISNHEVSTGPHTLNISLTGYQSVTEPFTITGGQTLNFNYPLVELLEFINVTSTPPGATVLLDDVDIGLTPISNHEVSTGPHTLDISLTDYQSVQEPFTIAEGETKNFDYTLVPIAQLAYINVTSVPEGATVLLDTVDIGLTPISNHGFSAEGGEGGPIALVQSKTDATVYSTQVTTFGITLDLPATAGNLIVTGVAIDKASGPIIVPVGFTLVQKSAEAAGDISSGAMAYKISDGTETDINWSWDTPQDVTMWVGEFSGLLKDQALVLDTSTENEGYLTESDNGSHHVGPVTTSQADELALAIYFSDSGNAVGLNQYFTDDFTTITDYTDPIQGSGSPYIHIANKILTAIGTVETTHIHDGTGDESYTTLATFKADLGGHTLDISLAGYEPIHEIFTIAEGETKNFNYDLVLTAPPSYINVTSVPEGATVLLDTVDIGVTPISNHEMIAGGGGTRTLYFREDGTTINKTEDITLNENNPDFNEEGQTSILIDIDDPPGSGLHKHSVIRFPNIFGDEDGQIPLGSNITEANLTLEVVDEGDDIRFYRLIHDWNALQVTWNSNFTGNLWTSAGAYPNDVDTSYYVQGTASPIQTYTYDIINFVQNWSDGLPNYGLLIYPTGAGGVDITSSEGISTSRPLLKVVYEIGGGSHTLDISLAGYEPMQEPFTIAEGETKNFNYDLVPAEGFRFTLTSDSRGYTGFTEVLADINTVLGDEGAFHISVGDEDPPETTYTDLKSVFGDGVVWYPLMGNHEVDPVDYRQWLYNYYDNHLQAYVNSGPLGGEKTTYSWDVGNVHFVFLNEYYKNNNDWGIDGDVSDGLYNWLVDDLNNNSLPIIFVLGHEPAYPDTPDNVDDRHVGYCLDLYPANRDRFWDLLKQKGVMAYFTAHTHRPSVYLPPGGNVWEINPGEAKGRGTYDAFVNVIVGSTDVKFECYRYDAGGNHYLWKEWSVGF